MNFPARYVALLAAGAVGFGIAARGFGAAESHTARQSPSEPAGETVMGRVHPMRISTSWGTLTVPVISERMRPHAAFACGLLALMLVFLIAPRLAPLRRRRH